MGEIAQRANGGAPPIQTDNVSRVIAEIRPSLPALPLHINEDQYVATLIGVLRGDDALRSCLDTQKGWNSILGAMHTSAQLGLIPGPLGHAYLIPYSGEVQFQLGYKGHIELARRSGQIVDIYGEVAFEADAFHVSRGVGGTLTHGINIREDRGDAICYYAYAELKDGGHSYVYKTPKEIIAHRDKYSKGSKRAASPWQTEFHEMAKKTMLIALCKVLPISIEYAGAMAKDGRVVNMSGAGTTTVVDVTPPKQDDESTKWLVGEIVEMSKRLVSKYGAKPAELITACGTSLSEPTLRSLDLERLSGIADILNESLTVAGQTVEAG